MAESLKRDKCDESGSAFLLGGLETTPVNSLPGQVEKQESKTSLGVPTLVSPDEENRIFELQRKVSQSSHLSTTSSILTSGFGSVLSPSRDGDGSISDQESLRSPISVSSCKGSNDGFDDDTLLSPAPTDGETDYIEEDVDLSSPTHGPNKEMLSLPPPRVPSTTATKKVHKKKKWEAVRKVVQWAPFVQVYKKKYPWVQDDDHEFVQAMSEGGGDLEHLNVMLHGPPGTGKSSLKRLILGEDPLPEEEQNSTDIMENAVRAVSMDRMKHFAVINDEDLIELLAAGILDHILPQENSQSSIQEDAMVNTLAKTIAVNLAASSTLQMIWDKLKHAKPSSNMFSSKWHHLIDSGGQPQFQDILPLVYSGPALQIVLMRLTEDLDEKPKMCYTEKGRNALKNQHRLQLTNRQYIEGACQIAASSGHTSCVMIVGTHKDKLGDDGEAKIMQLNERLEKIREKYREVLICKSDDEVIFDLNTMATGKEREEYTEDLQDVIKEMSEELAQSTPVPLKWFAFHLDISRDTSGVVRIEDCYKSGEALGMDKGAVRSALVYLNKAALLLYYPDDIPDLVLTKVDPLVNKLSQLVKASFITPKRILRSQCEALRNTGVFNKNFLEIIDDKSTSTALSNDEFLQLLLCLKIAASVDENKYFLPSALSFDQPSELPVLQGSCVPVGFSWSSCILPHGFFCTVTIELFSECSNCTFELCTKVKQSREEFFLNEKSNKIPGIVKLCNRTSWIEVSTSSPKEYCPAIFKAVHDAIQNTLERFKHTGLKPPEVVSLCPLSGCSSKDPHYCILTPDKKMFTCSEVLSAVGPVTPEMTCWMEGTDSNLKQLSTDFSISAAHPSSKDVYRLLRSKSSDWDEIGESLGVDFDYRTSLHRDRSLTDNRRMEDVVNKWLESRCSEPSWNNLIKALSDIKWMHIADDVKKFVAES